MLRAYFLAAVATLVASGARAQTQDEPPPAGPEAQVPLDQADIAVVLTAHADTVRFHGPPKASIRLYAEPGGSVEAKYEPGLLPRLIRPTVTYSNLNVSFIGGALLAASEEGAEPAPATPR